MKRGVHLLRLFWSTSLAAEMEYRLNFLVAAVTSAGGLAGSLFGVSLFYRQNYHLGGWSWHQALIVLGLFTLLEGLASTFLSPNLGRIVRHVQTGTLDFVLLKPVDSQFWVSTRNFSPWGLPDVLLGLGVLVYAGVRLRLPTAHIAFALLPAALAVTVLYGLWFLLGATTIWFVKIYNVTEVLRSLLEAGRFPMSAYPIAFRVFFTYVVPVAFLTTVPAEAMLGRAGSGWLIAAAGVAAALAVVSRWFWRFALRFYTSASS